MYFLYLFHEMVPFHLKMKLTESTITFETLKCAP